MDMSSFFPTNGMGNLLSSQPSPHVSFRAGILNRDPNTNQVTADPRKGTVQITTSEDRLMHLQWRPRNNPTPEQDLILFSGETELKQVTSCPASARVYVLKWKEQADTRMFFWMQGSDPTQDAANIAAANNILENGPDNQQPMSTVSPIASSTTPTQPHQTTPGDADVNMRTALTTSTPPTQPLNPNPITLDQVRAAMPRHEDAAAQRELVLTTPSLVDLLDMEQLQTIFANPRVQALLPRLFEHLPDQDRSIDGLHNVLRSQPFRSQAASLSHALQRGGASDILRTFDLPMEDSFSPYGLKAFLEALMKYQKDSANDQ